MAKSLDQAAYRTVEHVLAVLRGELPAELRTITGIGAHAPALLNQLPFISVSAEAMGVGPAGLGTTIDLKRERIDGALVDLGYVTGNAGRFLFMLNLWSITRFQLADLRAGVAEISWVQREHTWEAPEGILNRTVFMRCRLNKQLNATLAQLPAFPPYITIQSQGNVFLFASPSPSAERLGQADRGDRFELLGKSRDGDWLNGCCLNGRPVWIRTGNARVSVPISAIPVTEDVPIDPDSLQPGKAILFSDPGDVPHIWRQDLQYQAHLEATQEPIVDAGERIAELRITRQVGTEEPALDVERTRLFADREEIVDEFPD